MGLPSAQREGPSREGVRWEEMSERHADDARIALADLRVDRAALVAGGFAGDEIAAMRRHVKLAAELRGCRYFTQEGTKPERDDGRGCHDQLEDEPA
jgi:hypothetical protein